MLNVPLQRALTIEKFTATAARHFVVRHQVFRGKHIARYHFGGTFHVLIGFGICKGEQLLVSEALQHHCWFLS